MTPFWPFFLHFLLACAATALVQTLVREPEPERPEREGVQLFAYIAGGILAISLVVHLVEVLSGKV